MAREPSITQEQVSRAAETIRDAGGRPTARAIRERLGAGSMATVLKLFQAWQGAQIRPAEEPGSLPQSLQRGLLDFVAAEVERSRLELRTELDIANQTNADLIVECERLGLIVENLTAALEAVHAEKAELAGRLTQVETDLDGCRHEAATERQGAEVARTELAKALLRLEAMPRLEGDLVVARKDAAAERVGRVDAEQASAVALAKLDAAIEARKQLDAALLEAKERETVVRAELVSVRADLKQELATSATLRDEIEARSRSRGRVVRSLTVTKKKP
jgi:DNA repair exonuclease SbcCD ATPase subunit